MIDVELIEIPISRQCELLGMSRSGYYYQPQGESVLNLHFMNLIDEQYTKMPFYGVDKMTAWIRKSGYPANLKRIRRLMRKMGLEAIYPKRNLSISSADHKKYPYLLRDLAIEHPDQVWCADITYIRMADYDLKTAHVMLDGSRYLYVGFMCHQVIEKALKGLYVKRYGKIPPYTHNLLTLCADLELELTEEQKKFFIELNPLNIKARYPEVKENLGRIISKKKAHILLEKTKGAYKWLKSKKK